MSKAWKNVVVETQEEVKAAFSGVYASLDLGACIVPQDYFVSYIFGTEKVLNKVKEIGLLQKISNYHKQLPRRKEYPERGTKNCTFASQEDCDREYSGNWYYYYK